MPCGPDPNTANRGCCPTYDWVVDFEEKNEGDSPSYSQMRKEERAYKKENPFELPYTEQDIKALSTSRRFEWKKGMTQRDEDEATFKNMKKAKTREEKQAVLEAADRLGK